MAAEVKDNTNEIKALLDNAIRVGLEDKYKGRQSDPRTTNLEL